MLAFWLCGKNLERSLAEESASVETILQPTLSFEQSNYRNAKLRSKKTRKKWALRIFIGSSLIVLMLISAIFHFLTMMAYISWTLTGFQFWKWPYIFKVLIIHACLHPFCWQKSNYWILWNIHGAKSFIEMIMACLSTILRNSIFPIRGLLEKILRPRPSQSHLVFWWHLHSTETSEKNLKLPCEIVAFTTVHWRFFFWIICQDELVFKTICVQYLTRKCHVWSSTWPSEQWKFRMTLLWGETKNHCLH